MRQSLKHILLGLSLLVLSGLFTDTFAQGQDRQVTFTGFLTGGRNNDPLPGAYIYIPKAGKGVLSAPNGYFALPVFPGDSVIFSYVGFRTQYHIIPSRLADLTYSAVVALQEDVKTLAEVKVYPYATEELFKDAFVNLKLPDEKERENLAKNTSPEAIMRQAATMPMGALANHQNFVNQQFFGRESVIGRSQTPTFSFTNPFAWANFIRSVKRGDLKNKEWRSELNKAPRENVSRKDLLQSN
ncbi:MULTISPECIES: carboxypeptidase-like regulatory domain-containing protein [Spirosoma]|uniref:Carboxypeptidase-like regulatory domain-containing protein n=1 Tax=Spirosoma liriopis TaxID=2937440 RepID=A0ABT0HPR7_9BACT|nr:MULTISPECIES: carboxypeptidase-like regulatory domain-containing protein [Spirosoma]MCK8494160.1 carboxypeptidase-like regulatory domain-containing protein [Spirosoma liriopis]UHG89174.1 carboxypeptidase-like regulatory domain-containing protein [Spirosoma oryzicola]